MKNVIKRVFTIVLLCVVLLDSVPVYADPIGPGNNGINTPQNNGGGARCAQWAVRLKAVSGDGYANSMEAYMGECFNKWDNSWFEPSIVNDIFTFTYGTGPCEIYALGNGTGMLIDDWRSFSSVEYVEENWRNALSSETWQTLYGQVRAGRDWRDLLMDEYCVRAGSQVCGTFMTSIMQGFFPEYLNILRTYYTEEEDLLACYMTIVFSFTAETANPDYRPGRLIPFSEELLDTLWATKNRPGSSTYIFLEIVSGGTFGNNVFYTYPTYFGEAWGVSPTIVAKPNPNVAGSSISSVNADTMLLPWVNMLKNHCGSGLANYPSGASSSTPFFNCLPGKFNSAYKRHWASLCYQLDVTDADRYGQISSTYIGDFLFGNLTGTPKAIEQISASPKDGTIKKFEVAEDFRAADVVFSAAIPRTTVIGYGGAEYDGNAMYETLLANYKPRSTLTFKISRNVVSGGSVFKDNEGKVIDNHSMNAVLVDGDLVVTPVDKDDFKAYLDGTKSVAIQDNGLYITDDVEELRIKYSSTLTINIGSTTAFTALTRGTIMDSDTVGSDYALWRGRIPTFEYHSSNGEGYAGAGKSRAEIKANVPNKETWEAMGGVPTTESMYVAAGGMTHQVDYKGRMQYNPQTSVNVTINVTHPQCWGTNPACTETGGCNDPESHGRHPEPVEWDALGNPTRYEDKLNPCDRSCQKTLCAECGLVGLGSCSSPQNKCHPADCVMSFTINIPIQEFAYVMTIYAQTLALEGMTFEQNTEVFQNGGSAKAPVTNTTVFAPPLTSEDHADYVCVNGVGNGRLLFSGWPTSYGPSISWGDVVYNVTTPTSGGVHEDHKNELVETANEVLHALQGHGYTCTVIGDYIVINSADTNTQNVVFDSYNSDTCDWFAGIPDFTETETIREQNNPINSVHFNAAAGSPINQLSGLTAEQMRSPESAYTGNINRDLKGPEDICTTGYNGRYDLVYNNGVRWSGKFETTGTSHPSSVQQYIVDGQPNVKVYTCEPYGTDNGGNSTNSGMLHPTLSCNDIHFNDVVHNGEVKTGKVYLNYVNQLNTKTTGLRSADVSDGGMDRKAKVGCSYTLGIAGLNNIVVHNPVSTEYTHVVSNPDEWDERVTGSIIMQGGDSAYEDGVFNGATGEWVKNPDIPFINVANWFSVEISDFGNFGDGDRLGIESCVHECLGGTVKGRSGDESTEQYGFVGAMTCDTWTKNRTITFPFPVCYYDKDGNYLSVGGNNEIDTSTLSGVDVWRKLDNTVVPSNDVKQSGKRFVHKDTGEVVILYHQYRFFAPLNVTEAPKASVTFRSYATNSVGLTNPTANGINNKYREGSHAARHVSETVQYTDVVGYIGNLTINDTGDFRFAELFKQVADRNKWLIPNLVHEVNYAAPNKTVADPYDILRNKATADTAYHSTFGITAGVLSDGRLVGKATDFATLPLDGSDNPIRELRSQQMRPGYDLFMDVETIGNYYGENYDENGNDVKDKLWQRMTVHPYYYFWDYDTKLYTPLDVYYQNDGVYVPVTLFNEGAKKRSTDWDYYLDWAGEKARRNYTSKERTVTERVKNKYDEEREKWLYSDDEPPTPIGLYTPKVALIPEKYEYIGNANTLFLDQFNRTFIGSSTMYGYGAGTTFSMFGNNFDGVSRDDIEPWSEIRYNRQSQRWHFTLGLPSSVKFVPAGYHYDPGRKGEFLEESRKISERNGVIVCLVDIKVQGEVWALQYDGSGIWDPDGDGTPGIPGIDPDQPLPIPTPDNTTPDPGHPVDPTDPINPPWGDPDDPDEPPYPPITIYDPKYTSADDLRTEGTH